ncbi:MAG: ribosome recycling factor [Myxococcota bacterium]|jgi:ribosome recycling factor|nr:ribosome recycling factor [Myxococcota bacterium]
MLKETLAELKDAIEKAHDSLKRELAKIRTGRANADILDGIRVEYYGTPTPLRQMASISVPEARLITVKVFDRSQISAVERAIQMAQLGVNPSNDGELIRIPMPPLTEERRKELVKVARSKGEDCRVVIRKARHECKDMIDTLEKDGEIGGDEADRGKKDMEDITKAGNTRVDEIVAAKEKDILEV